MPSYEKTVWCLINVLEYTLYNLPYFERTLSRTVHTIAINYELVIVSDPFSTGSAIILGSGEICTHLKGKDLQRFASI